MLIWFILISIFCLQNDVLAAGRMATSEESVRFDSSFTIWKKAWLEKDAATLMNVYGYADFQVKNASDKLILHFDEYNFIKAVILREENGEKRAQLYYEVSKATAPDQKMLLIISADDGVSMQQPFIGSWQVFPSEENPKVYTHDDLIKLIDKLIGMSLK
jgi:hypothetical protein